MRLFITVLLLSPIAIFAQSPGGVSGNLRGWYNANTGITLAGVSNVSQWNDLSGNSFHATQGTGTNRPAQSVGAINYNNAISFDGQDNYLNIPDLVASTATGLSAFAVARQVATNRDIYGCILVGQTNNIGSSGGYGITSQVPGNTAFGIFIRDFGVNYVSYNTTLPIPAIISGIWNGTTANAVQCFHNGTSQGTDNYTPGSIGDNGNSYIGSGVGAGSDYCFYGDIAEIAVYNTGLNAASKDRINSYLGVKYGITLTTDYVNNAGTTIFATATPYNNNIIGIGRDDNSGLTQKQSHNNDDSVRVYISTLAATNSANTGAFASNASHVIVGANTGRLSAILTEKPATVYSRLQREWKVTNTNFSSTFNMDIELSAIAATGSVSAANLRLLVDGDGDFSNATVYAAGSGLSFSYANPVITVTGIGTAMIPVGTTSYITIASAAAATPLPIEWLNFEAAVCSGEVCLSWQTASEKNNERFEIERSTDGIHWEKTGEVRGAGNSSAVLSYTHVDKLAFMPGTVYYYRLKQVDSDGQSDYSKIVTIMAQETDMSELHIYPNPAENEILVEGLKTGEGNILVLNSTGHIINDMLIMTSNANGTLHLNTEKLPSGVYYFQASGQQGIKFLIKR